MKRRLEEGADRADTVHFSKRPRYGPKTHILDLSDELLLRILIFLPVATLARCGSVCRKFKNLSEDNELWREKYYIQFVKHRARRLPSLKTASSIQRDFVLSYSSPGAPWLELSQLVKNGSTTSWKRLYKVKHNWTRGRARTTEILVAPKSSSSVIACLQNGDLFTADAMHGLRSWRNSLVTLQHAFQAKQHPSAMVIERRGRRSFMAVGFTDGSVDVFSSDGTEIGRIAHRKVTNGSICAIATAWPYMMTMSVTKSIDLFAYREEAESLDSVANLHTTMDISPASLSLQRAGDTLIAGIAYAFNRFNTGWCLGLQEVRMDVCGTTVKNRVSTSVDTPLRDTLRPLKPSEMKSRSTCTAPFSLHPSFARAPNSLSYCGCYILASLPDNTLMVYVVTSTDEKLEISMGRRLWGHTSAVSSAEVTSTGKALSISATSNEMRYWELEDLLTSSSQKRASVDIRSLSTIDEALRARGNGLGIALKEMKDEKRYLRKHVAFDDEQAIVLSEMDQNQVISCFNFA